MIGDQKCFSIFVFVIVTLLSCCSPVSSYVTHPRVTRTRDAIIIDFAGVGYAHPYQGKNYGEVAQIANPGSTPYSMMYQQQPKFYNGWSYFYAYPSDINPADARATYLQYGEDNERQAAILGIKPNTTTTPAIKCGRGPATFPTTRGNQIPFQSLVSGKIAGDGATEAKRGAWPFMVALLKDGDVKCGGVLISDSKVLLAAQCLERLNLAEMNTLTVAIGMQVKLPLDARMTRRISKIVLHIQFDASNYANDIAIITLDAPVPLSKNVASVCLPPANTDPDQYADQDAVVMGWGESEKLQYGTVSIVSNEECRSMDNIGQYVSNATICISSENTFTCENDIGGPVVVMSSPGTWTLVGINSFTVDCDSNGLKTRVSAFRSWIDQYMQI